MKILKLIGLSLAVVVGLAVLIIGVFVATFDANEYKQELSDLVKQQTGRDLTFKGDIGLTLFPSLGMNLGSMQFSNAAGFGNEPMLAVNRARVSVDVMSILSMNPQVAELELDGLTLRLQKDRAGNTNWQDLTGDTADTETVKDEVESEQGPASTSKSGLAIGGSFGGLNITQAELNWLDQTTGDQYQVLVPALTTGRIEPGKPFPLAIELRVQNKQQLKATLTLNSEVTADEASVQLNSMTVQGSASGDMIPVTSSEFKLVADVDFQMAQQQLSVKGFNTHLSSQGGVLQQAQVNLSGEIGFNLAKQVLTIAALDLSTDLTDPSVPRGKITASVSSSQLTLPLTQRAIKMEELMLSVGENQFKGFVDVSDYAQPAVAFELKSDKVDVDALLGESSEESVAPTTTETPPEKQDVPINLPLELLRKLQLDGKIQIADLKAKGLKLNDVNISITASKGIIRVDPFLVDLYQGNMNSSLTLDVTGAKPVYQINQKLAGFQFGPFLKDLLDNDMVSGVTNLDIKMTTSGDMLSQLRSNLDGTIALAVNDGALKGLNLRHKMDVAKAKLRNEDAPPLVEEKTDFSALSLSGNIVKGVLKTNDLDVQAPLMRVNGEGSIDIGKETLDYLIKSKLVATSKGQQGGTADEIGGIPLPVAITGSWFSPKIDIQYDEMLKASLDAKKAKISAEVAAQKAKLQQQLAEEKARLKAAQEKEKAALQEKLEQEQKLAEEKRKAEIEAKKQEAKDKLQDKLKKLF